MKITIDKLTQILRDALTEAAKEGHIQKVYRDSYKRMVKKAASGGNKNTPPFTKKAAKPGKSGVAAESKKRD